MNPTIKTFFKYCFACKTEGHDFLSCQNIFFLKSASNVISKLRVGASNKREVKERKCPSRSNALFRQDFISAIALTYAQSRGMQKQDLDAEYKRRLFGDYHCSNDLFDEVFVFVFDYLYYRMIKRRTNRAVKIHEEVEGGVEKQVKHSIIRQQPRH